jgi:hypothetical protein
MGYECATRDHDISQNGRKAQQNGPVSHRTHRKKRKTHTISSHRTVRRKAHRLLGQKIALRYPQACLWGVRVGRYSLFPRHSVGHPSMFNMISSFADEGC